MLEPFVSLFTLRWRNQPHIQSLPKGIMREFIPTSTSQHQKLELLIANSTPQSGRSTINGPPLLFLHGGLGSAAVYIPFMTYCSTHYQSSSSTYALSMRGRGASYSLSYLKLVYGTTLRDLASDLVSAVEHITKVEGRPPVILGHSSGGGVVQYALANNLTNAKTPGLILLGAVPNFGNVSAYANWARCDPWFVLRMLLHLYHTASPLSSPQLVRNAFFSSEFAAQDNMKNGSMTKSFMTNMAPYESLIWPLQMMHGVWTWMIGGKEQWLDAKDILGGIDLTSGRETADKVCIIVGDEDALMDIPNQTRMANEYRSGIEQLWLEKKIDWTPPSDNINRGVRFHVLSGGHHVQNDIHWEEAAKAVVEFAEQL